jgi:hypothetical protein
MTDDVGTSGGVMDPEARTLAPFDPDEFEGLRRSLGLVDDGSSDVVPRLESSVTVGGGVDVEKAVSSAAQLGGVAAVYQAASMQLAADAVDITASLPPVSTSANLAQVGERWLHAMCCCCCCCCVPLRAMSCCWVVSCPIVLQRC